MTRRVPSLAAAALEGKEHVSLPLEGTGWSGEEGGRETACDFDEDGWSLQAVGYLLLQFASVDSVCTSVQRAPLASAARVPGSQGREPFPRVPPQCLVLQGPRHTWAGPRHRLCTSRVRKSHVTRLPGDCSRNRLKMPPLSSVPAGVHYSRRGPAPAQMSSGTPFSASAPHFSLSEHLPWMPANQGRCV